MDTGLDRLIQNEGLLSQLRARRVGLLTHPAAVDRNLRHVSELLRNHGVGVSLYLGPEHGYGGEAQDMAEVGDLGGAIPVRSLYGTSFDDLSPRASDLAALDVLVVDLQDVGARYYTFVWTAVLALRAAHACKVPVWVLDRPNPLGHETVEGAFQEEGYLSFVGLAPVPIRHALSLGEIVLHIARVEGMPKESLTVVRWEGDPRVHAPSWDRPFVMPSPNMPTYEAALVYPGGCLLEGTNLSEGRGTTRPFEMFGAPWLDAERLAKGLSGLSLPGCALRTVSFQPTFHKYAGERCAGLFVHVTDPQAFRPVYTYVAALALMHHAHPEHFRFRTERYEFVDDIPAIDLLTGGPHVRKNILEGGDPRGVAEQCSRVTPHELARRREMQTAMPGFGV